MSKDRMEFIRDYYRKQNDVVVEIPAASRKVGNKSITSRFSGYRCGYKFIEGKATVKREDLHKLQVLYPNNLIIHDEAGEK
jgi:hypothetical protein